jgi:hypothetical protein
MPVCTACKGKKKVTQNVVVIDTEGRTTESFTMECFTCKGTGRLTKAQIEENKRAAEAWCKCDEPDMENAQYWPDGAHPECSKHCWTCGKCGKIAQVG